MSAKGLVWFEFTLAPPVWGPNNDGLSLPRHNFQTFWEPQGQTILKETRKV